MAFVRPVNNIRLPAIQVAADQSIFPLSVSSSGRYLQTAGGEPFVAVGDTPWSITAQLTTSEMDTYLGAMGAVGVKALLFQVPTHTYTSQTPHYNNVSGIAPFSNMSTWAGFNAGYWNPVDHLIDGAYDRGILCIVNPMYLGNSLDGWLSDMNSMTQAQRIAYGVALGNRYGGRNVVWCLGGDEEGTTTERDRQMDVANGILSVDPGALFTGHASPDLPAYPYWNSYSQFTVNAAYPGAGEVASAVKTEWDRSPVRPVINLEDIYEQERGDPQITAQGLRRQMYQALHSGACISFFGNNPRWNFEGRAIYSYTGTWETSLTSTGTLELAHASALIASQPWHLLEPKTDTTLVTTSLGSGNSKICPALASDGTFASVWKPTSGAFTVNMGALSVSSIRARWYDPTSGAYSNVSGQPFANSGTQSLTAPGERVLVLDAA